MSIFENYEVISNQKLQSLLCVLLLLLQGPPEIFGRPGFFSLGSLEEKMLNLTLPTENKCGRGSV